MNALSSKQVRALVVSFTAEPLGEFNLHAYVSYSSLHSNRQRSSSRQAHDEIFW